ncbi:MAG: hypothetical protein GY788_17240 [bacterium]|nr:hypothetical protein [bacterium]
MGVRTRASTVLFVVHNSRMWLPGVDALQEPQSIGGRLDMAFPWAGNSGPFDPKNGEVLDVAGFIAGSFASIGAVIPYILQNS